MKPTLLIHGGAGTVARDKFTPERQAQFLTALRDIARAGQVKLLAGESAVDAVAHAVRLLEDDPLFNAGMGSVLTEAQTIEMDACIMDGRDKSAGAVTCVSRIKNPILLAKAVMQHSPHVCFAREGAEKFAEQQGIALIDSDALVVPERLAQLQAMRHADTIALDHDGEYALSNRQANPIDEKDKYGTVGAVALDQFGNLAAATSTGGMTNKALGRVGDTPIIGAGCYADASVAVSCTGVGETFMRGVIAHDIAARMRYGGEDLHSACQHAIDDTLANVNGEGGLIAIDKGGNFALPMNTSGMYRAQAVGDSDAVAKIFCDD
ncbi:MAG: beta-aspartyl-peptidase [Gammaproteobacteria bacterium]|nr:MAG: beta-aspartyl-peptidase [Gammaproteobacteria bacterium]